MILGIHHVGISVADLDAAACFYTDAFGLREMFRFALSDSAEGRAMLQLSKVAGKAVFLAAPNMIVELIEFDPAGLPEKRDRPVSLPGITHFCMQSGSMTEAENRFRAAGGSFPAAPTDLGADILYAYPRDPDGNVIELEALPGTGEQGSWAAHVSITTPDIDRAAAFYEQLTGATARRLPHVGPNPKIDHLTGLSGAEASGAWLPLGNAQLELWQYRSHPLRPLRRALNDAGYSHFALEVDDVAEERTRAEALGMSFEGEPIVMDDVAVTYGRDPDGNVVEFIAFAGAAERHSLSALVDPGIVERVEQRLAAQRAVA